ncbi:hypothetical protein I5Q34_25340 [Streptomyces sp. AV19]|uniref:hypothetical protein n=1 Tax=Streptomyces sp. AV19 TaxID=2793068 RepID=UPI0018FEDFD6|nr:hypothetical protein [Streptomyces sp. AV19]MBH1937554.1 hypothetical protein [Streptomyces sp. AV19]MDG4536438.1 hypothetical protein [Streptomyces sp. AV19]
MADRSSPAQRFRYAARRVPPWRTGRPLDRPAVVPLVWAAALFGVAQAVAVPLWLPLGWDEAVYVSQVSPRVPSAFFSAPRARGISWLAAPAVLPTGSTVVLRAWMLLLATAGLVAAFWPWRRLVGETCAALAAALFAGLWVVGFYADEVMPNLYVAYGATAATGWFLRAVGGRGRRRCLYALAAAVAFTALIRASDAAFLALALLAALLLVTAWRSRALAVAVAGGLAVGLLPWVAEAYAAFGGPLARLRAGSDVQGGMRWTNALGMHLRALNGPLLCRPCTVSWTHRPLALWWLATPLLTAGALLAARRRGPRGGRAAVLALPVACAGATAAPYLFLLAYAAPRFLMPAYALLAVPVAALALGLVRRAGHRWRPAVAALLALGFALHLASQYLVLHSRISDQMRLRTATREAARRLGEAGVRPPCTLVGPEAVLLAFHAGCSSEALSGNNASTTPARLALRARTQATAYAAHTPAPPGPARSWPGCVLRMPGGTDWYVFLAPAAYRAGRC